MDALSELLRTVKLSGAMFFDARCGAPWCVRSPPAALLARYVAPEASHLIEFHLLAAGRAWIRVGTETTLLTAGDIVMLPHGDEHFLGNGLGAEAIDSEPALPALLCGEMLSSRMGTETGEETRLICGYLACETPLLRPVLAGLPHVLRVPIRADAYGEVIETMIRHAVDQAAGAAPGSGAIVARLAEVLFAEVLRRYVLQLPPGRTGWLAAASDASLGRALECLHARPGESWTVDSLAQASGMSRSVLTERFARYLGQGPIAYLTEWRLQLAAEALRATSRSVLQIAGESGYESQAAFNRAFKRRFSMPPAAYRLSVRKALPSAPRADAAPKAAPSA